MKRINSIQTIQQHVHDERICHLSCPYISLLLLCALLPMLVCSCLSEEPRGQLTEEEAIDNLHSLYVNKVATLYNYMGGNADSEGLQGTYRGVYDFNTFTTDEAMLPTRGGDWYDGGFWQRLYLHQWTASDASLAATWNYLYKVVVQCNESLASINAFAQQNPSAQTQSYTAEVRAVRALFYYYLMDMFGRIPLVTDVNVKLEDIRQSKRSEVFQFIVKELQQVEPLLPAERSNHEGSYYGRLTRPVADFLLARLALNAEIYTHDDWTSTPQPSGASILFTVEGRQLNAWETCIHYCNALADYGYDLEPQYATNFCVNNETSVENIFCIPMDKALYANVFKNLFRSRHYQHGSALGMDAENGTSATLSTCAVYGYGTSEVDNRWTVNFYADAVYVDGQPVMLEDGTPLVYRPLEVRLDLSGSVYEKTAGARMSKYEIDRTAYSDGHLQNNDIVLFRYADVLLMKSEAKVRNGGNGDGELNQVRSRVGMPTRAATLATLLDERLMELMWEGTRRQDMIRFGCFHQSYDQRPQQVGETTGYTTVFPIPSSVLALNKNLSQNPGY